MSSKDAAKAAVSAAPPPKKKDDDRQEEMRGFTWLAFALLLVVSKLTLPSELSPSKPGLLHVWYYGWVTALSTGLGAVPLVFVKAHDLGKQMLGVSNAIACGMMLSATYSLVKEGCSLEPDSWAISEGWHISEGWRVAIGVIAGLIFILGTKAVLDKYEDLKVGELSGMDARKVLLIVFVMTLHSFSEGVGIGVSFGGVSGAQLGVLISATLAVHNVPEGLAVALVLHPRGVSKANTCLWCIFTSLPQPLMAVPAFMFVEEFLHFLPVGLGFAAGAMFWVACFELFVDAVEDTSKLTAVVTTVLAFVAMLCVHSFIEGVEHGL
ncbi:unnamed protein product [Chrysoparadoxa australica]